MTGKPNTEIERKFLVTSDAWRIVGEGTKYRQGYLAWSDTATIRVRSGGGSGYVTVKGRRTGVTRVEYEYEIPAADADEMIDTLCEGRTVEKTRYLARHAGFVWEIDEFHGANEGLVVAEIELDSEDQAFEKPEWVGREVSQDIRYTNARLSQRPWAEWGR